MTQLSIAPWRPGNNGDPSAAVFPEQRNGIEVESRDINTPARVHQIVSLLAGGAGKDFLVEHSAGKGLPASGACDAIGVEVFIDLAQENGLAADLVLFEDPGGNGLKTADISPVGVTQGGRNGLGYVLAASELRKWYERNSGAGVFNRSFYDDLGNIRRRLIDGLLDGRLESDRRRRTTVAASFQPQRDTPCVRHANELNIPAVRTKVGPGFFQGFDHTRRKVQRMKAVEQQQASDQIVSAEIVDQALSRLTCAIDNLQHALETCAVKVHQRLNELLREAAGRGVRKAFDFPDQALNGLDPLLNLFLLGHLGPSLVRTFCEKLGQSSLLAGYRSGSSRYFASG